MQSPADVEAGPCSQQEHGPFAASAAAAAACSQHPSTPFAASGNATPTQHQQQPQQQQQQQQPLRHTFGSKQHTVAQRNSDLRTALNALVCDIYSISVRYIVASHAEGAPNSFRKNRGWKILWLLATATFTFGLQMTLVILLWNAASLGNAPVVRPQADKLWQQVGLAHQMLCRIQHYISDDPNTTLDLPPVKDCNCTGWWPDNPIGYATAQSCLSLEPELMTSDDCRDVLLSLNSSFMSYGRGLFLDPMTLLEGSNDNTTDTESTIENSSSHHKHHQRQMNVSGLNFMMEKMDYFIRIDPFFFMMFSFISLAIVVHQEFKQAVWLCYIAAGCVGILPPFYGRRPNKLEWRVQDHDATADHINPALKLAVLTVPVLQLIAALAVLATGGVLFLFEQNQTDAVNIIINSVALVFILEVDNRLGTILSLREDWDYPFIRSPHKATVRTASLKWGPKRSRSGIFRRGSNSSSCNGSSVRLHRSSSSLRPQPSAAALLGRHPSFIHGQPYHQQPQQQHSNSSPGRPLAAGGAGGSAVNTTSAASGGGSTHGDVQQHRLPDQQHPCYSTSGTPPAHLPSRLSAVSRPFAAASPQLLLPPDDQHHHQQDVQTVQQQDVQQATAGAAALQAEQYDDSDLGAGSPFAQHQCQQAYIYSCAQQQQPHRQEQPPDCSMMQQGSPSQHPEAHGTAASLAGVKHALRQLVQACWQALLGSCCLPLTAFGRKPLAPAAAAAHSSDADLFSIGSGGLASPLSNDGCSNYNSSSSSSSWLGKVKALLCYCYQIYNWRSLAGYGYMSLVGALIYAEVCFLAPQSAAQMLAFVVLVFTNGGKPDGGAVAGGIGIVPQFISNPQNHAQDSFPNTLFYLWSFGGIFDGFYGARNQTFSQFSPPPSPGWILAAFVLYGVCTVLFVVLLCARILPSSSHGWTVGLMLSQLVLALVVQLQDSTYLKKCNEPPLIDQSVMSAAMRAACPRNWWWLIVVAVFGTFWFVMFVVLPPLLEYIMTGHNYDRKPNSVSGRVPHAQQHVLASGGSASSGSCCTQKLGSHPQEHQQQQLVQTFSNEDGLLVTRLSTRWW